MAARPEDVQLVRALESDAPKLAQLCKKAFDTDVYVGAPGSSGGPPGYDSAEFQIRAMSWLHYYKIIRGERIVGGLLVDVRGRTHGVLERIFVDPDLHRIGIGTRAMETMFGLYPQVRLWTLGTPEWNVRTKSFYEKLGFVQVGWDHGEPGWRGRWYEKKLGEVSDVRTRIADLVPGMDGVLVEGIVVEKGEPRSVRARRSGEMLAVANAVLRDESGSITLTLWTRQIEFVNTGQRIRVENGFVSSFRGLKQLVSGQAGRLLALI